MARGEGWHRFSLRFSKEQWQQIERVRRLRSKSAKRKFQVSETLRWMIERAPIKITAELNGSNGARVFKTYAAWLQDDHWRKLHDQRMKLMRRSKRHVSINETFGYLIGLTQEN